MTEPLTSELRRATGCVVGCRYLGYPRRRHPWCNTHQVEMVRLGGDQLCLGHMALVPHPRSADVLPDRLFPPTEQLPLRFNANLVEVGGRSYRRTRLEINGQQLGDVIDDNSRSEDGYRHHDVLHLTHVAVLGWSPVIRSALGLKRRSDDAVNRTQDGARAQDIEEAICTRVFWDVMGRFPDFGEHVLSEAAFEEIAFVTHALEVADASYDDWSRVALVGAYGLAFSYFNGPRVAFDVDVTQGTVAPQGIGPTQLSLLT